VQEAVNGEEGVSILLDNGDTVSARLLIAAGYKIVATGGTAAHLQAQGIACEQVNKVAQGRPHIVDHIINGDIAMIINTTAGKKAISDSYTIRREALMHKVFYQTTIAGGHAVALALSFSDDEKVRALQEVQAG